MRTETRVWWGIAILALATFAFAQKPEEKKTIEPQMTAAERVSFQKLNSRFQDLQQQIDKLQKQQQEIGAEYQDFSKAIAEEHPGYTLTPQGQIVATPKPDAPAATTKK